MEFASNGKGNAALATGIIGTAGVGLSMLSGLFGGGCGCGGGMPYGVNHYELGLEQQVAARDAAIALRDANVYNDQKLLEFYKYVDRKFDEVHGTLSRQAVVNAQISSNLACMQKNLDVLNGLTKLYIPIDNITPLPEVAATATTGA